jgi:DUF1680 family protein
MQPDAPPRQGQQQIPRQGHQQDMTPDLQVELGGPLGEALRASLHGRLSRFIVDEHSPAIAVFAPEHTQHNLEGDWYGEHAGKWLVAAARAAGRTQDAVLAATVRRVTDHLISLQQSDGYLGTYAAARHFTQPQPPKPGHAGGTPAWHTWDGAPALRTWDIWTHSYLVLGLLEVHHRLGHPAALAAACRIGDLCWHALDTLGINITELGNHHGLSATVLMDPAMELYFATGTQRYLDLALRVLQQADANPALALLQRGLAGADAADVATGKAYQLAWNLVGLAKIHRATGAPELAQVLGHLWHSIRDHHLTPGGGPCGGVAHRSREVFNAPGSFSPLAYVETCSTLAWIQLNRQLLQATGQACYADEIERSAYNALLGAMAPNGEDWCYYSFDNGRRVHTTPWRCCKSSGAMALEELPLAAYGRTASGGLRVNLWGAGSVRLALVSGAVLRLEQRTDYPFDGHIELQLTPEAPAAFELALRIPAWAHGAAVFVNGQPVFPSVQPGEYTLIHRLWQAGDCVTLELPMPPVLLHQRLHNTQESRAPDGSPVRQQVLQHDYVAVARGPLVFATGLIDGFKTEETLRLRTAAEGTGLALLPRQAGEPPRIRWWPASRGPIDLLPAYCADGRVDGGWRITWLSLAPDAGSSKFQ